MSFRRSKATEKSYSLFESTPHAPWWFRTGKYAFYDVGRDMVAHRRDYDQYHSRDPGDPYIDASPIGGPSQEVRSVVRSWDAALRGNLLGFLPLRLDYSRPLNRPMVKHYWTLSLGPTF